MGDSIYHRHKYFYLVDFEKVLSRLYDCASELRDRSATLKCLRHNRAASILQELPMPLPPSATDNKQVPTAVLLQLFRSSCLLYLTALRRFAHPNSRPDGKPFSDPPPVELFTKQYQPYYDDTGEKYYPDATPMEEWVYMQKFRYSLRDELYGTFLELSFTHYAFWSPSDMMLIACTIDEYCRCYPFLTHHTWSPTSVSTTSDLQRYHDILQQYQSIVTHLSTWLAHAITWFHRYAIYKQMSIIPPQIKTDQLPQLLANSDLFSATPQPLLAPAAGQYIFSRNNNHLIQKLATSSSIPQQQQQQQSSSSNTTTNEEYVELLSIPKNLASVDLPPPFVTPKQAIIMLKEDDIVELQPKIIRDHVQSVMKDFAQDDFIFAHKDILLHFTEQKLDANLYALKRQQFNSLLATRMRGRSKGDLRRLVIRYVVLLQKGTLFFPPTHPLFQHINRCKYSRKQRLIREQLNQQQQQKQEQEQQKQKGDGKKKSPKETPNSNKRNLFKKIMNKPAASLSDSSDPESTSLSTSRRKNEPSTLQPEIKLSQPATITSQNAPAKKLRQPQTTVGSTASTLKPRILSTLQGEKLNLNSVRDMHSILQKSTFAPTLKLEPLPVGLSDADQERFYNHLFFKTANPTTISMSPIDFSNIDEVTDVHIRRYIYKALRSVLEQCSTPIGFTPPSSLFFGGGKGQRAKPKLSNTNSSTDIRSSQHYTATDHPISLHASRKIVNSPSLAHRTSSMSFGPAAVDDSVWDARVLQRHTKQDTAKLCDDIELSIMSSEMLSTTESAFSFENTTISTCNNNPFQLFQSILRSQLQRELSQIEPTHTFQNHTMRWYYALFDTILYDLSYSTYQFQRLVRFIRQTVELQQKHLRVINKIKSKQQQNMARLMKLVKSQQDIAWERAKKRNIPSLGFDIPLKQFYNKKEQELQKKQQQTLAHVIERNGFELREKIQQMSVLEHHAVNTCTSHLVFLLTLLYSFVNIHSFHQLSVEEVDNTIEVPSTSPDSKDDTTKITAKTTRLIPSRLACHNVLFSTLHYILLLHNVCYNYTRYFSNNTQFHFSDIYTIQPPPQLTQTNAPWPQNDILTKTTSIRVVTGNSPYVLSTRLLHDHTNYSFARETGIVTSTSSLTTTPQTSPMTIATPIRKENITKPLTKNQIDVLSLQKYTYDLIHEPIYSSSDDLVDFCDDNRDSSQSSDDEDNNDDNDSNRFSNIGKKILKEYKPISSSLSICAPRRYQFIGNKRLHTTPRVYSVDEQQNNDDDNILSWYSNLDYQRLLTPYHRSILTEKNAITAVQQSLEKIGSTHLYNTEKLPFVQYDQTLDKTQNTTRNNHAKNTKKQTNKKSNTIGQPMLPLESTREFQNLYLGIFAQRESSLQTFNQNTSSGTTSSGITSSGIAAAAIAAAAGETEIPSPGQQQQAHNSTNINDPNNPFAPSSMLSRRKQGIDQLQEYLSVILRTLFHIIGLYTCSCTSNTKLGKLASGFENRCACELAKHVLAPNYENWDNATKQVVKLQSQPYYRILSRTGDLCIVWRYLGLLETASARSLQQSTRIMSNITSTTRPPPQITTTAGNESQITNTVSVHKSSSTTGTQGNLGRRMSNNNVSQIPSKGNHHDSHHHHRHHRRHHHHKNYDSDSSTESRTRSASRTGKKHKSSRHRHSKYDYSSSDSYSRNSTSDDDSVQDHHGKIGGFFSNLFHKKK